VSYRETEHLQSPTSTAVRKLGSRAADTSLPEPVSRELDDRLLNEARRKFGYRALPRP
jgi:hypothetical protein